MKRIKSKYLHRFSLAILISIPTQSLLAMDKSGLAQTLNAHFPREISSLFISMLPIFELRGGIPVSIQVFHLSVVKAVLLSILGNIIPIIFLLLFWEWTANLLSKNAFLKKWIDKLQGTSLKRGKIIEEYKELGLMFFVAIPLPVTGAWTGSLVAVLLGLSFWKSLFYIFLGVCIAAVIVTSLTLLGKTGAIISLVILILLLIVSVAKIIVDKNKRNAK